ncbi:MAG TPA: hypothetical protein VFZ21_33025 [Gemmatimonadaceae bacterium]|jgi:hypothetical protein|nr:hypothetical protein [Gemmatimonadaceae bacterium]
MLRFLYYAGFTYIALCGAMVFRELRFASRGDPMPQMPLAHYDPPPKEAPAPRSSGREWFAAMKPYCNAVEVEVRTRFTPPPRTNEGAGFAAGCFALAGKIDRARAIIAALPYDGRRTASSVLFDIAHPAADAGDDRSSGPMMELVLEYWPNNYMALYHAGMSAYALGQPESAKKRLRAFLSLYTANDGFTNAAKSALARIEMESGAGRVRLRRNVEQDTTGRL